MGRREDFDLPRVSTEAGRGSTPFLYAADRPGAAEHKNVPAPDCGGHVMAVDPATVFLLAVEDEVDVGGVSARVGAVVGVVLGSQDEGCPTIGPAHLHAQQVLSAVDRPPRQSRPWVRLALLTCRQ